MNRATKSTRNNFPLWNRLPRWISVLLLIGAVMTVSGCSTTRDMTSVKKAFPLSGSDYLSGPVVAVFPVQETLPETSGAEPFKSDPTYLGKGLTEVISITIIPIATTFHEFHADMPRTDMIRTVTLARLNDFKVPAISQSKNDSDQFMLRAEDRLGLFMQLKKLTVDTAFSFAIPLIISNGLAYNDRVAQVALDCQLRQAGSSALLWEGTGESRITTEDMIKTGKQYQDVTLEAVTAAVDQCITNSGLVEIRARLGSQRYAKLMASGRELAQGGEMVKALDQYGQAYGTAMTDEESLAVTKAMAQLFQPSPNRPTLPEEVRKYKVQAEVAVRDKSFKEAAGFYEKAINLAPWWAEGHFNRALVLGEVGVFKTAILEMQHYLTLAPEAPNARAAQDKIYEWERKTQK